MYFDARLCKQTRKLVKAAGRFGVDQDNSFNQIGVNISYRPYIQGVFMQGHELFNIFQKRPGENHHGVRVNLLGGYHGSKGVHVGIGVSCYNFHGLHQPYKICILLYHTFQSPTTHASYNVPIGMAG